MGNETAATIIIADMHEIVREGIADKLTEAGCARVVGFASDGYTTISTCRKFNPDILLMDLSLIRPSGIDTFRKLRKILPEMKILVCSSEAETPQVFNTMSLGAIGFIPKQAKAIHFVNAVQSAAMGYSCVPCDYLDSFSKFRRTASRSGNVYGLSPREVEVLEACAAGQNTKEIADSLDISVRTVETHRNSIYKKTECNKVSQLESIYELL